MASTQVNLKVGPEVAQAWRAAAAAAGLSVRDWLIRETMGRPAGLTLESLAARVEALEARRQIAAAPAPPPAPALPPSLSERLERANGPQFTRDLARLLGRNGKALNKRATAGGIGTVVDGWEVVGQARPERGGPARWLWAPVAEG